MWVFVWLVLLFGFRLVGFYEMVSSWGSSLFNVACCFGFG